MSKKMITFNTFLYNFFKYFVKDLRYVNNTAVTKTYTANYLPETGFTLQFL